MGRPSCGESDNHTQIHRLWRRKTIGGKNRLLFHETVSIGAFPLTRDTFTTRTKHQVMEYLSQECIPGDSLDKPHGDTKSPAAVGVESVYQANLETESPRAQSARGFPEFSELVLACRHHLLLTALLGASVSTALVVLAWCVAGALFEAESLVRIRQHQEGVFAQRTSRADDADFIRAQEELALSPQVLAAALADEQVNAVSGHVPTHDAIGWLRGLVSIDIQSGAEVMSISVRHNSPQVSQILCNAVTRAYLGETANRLTSDRKRRHEELELAAREAQDRLDELWSQLNGVASTVGSDNSQSLTIRDEIQLQTYRDYAQQSRAAQMRSNELASRLVEAQRQTPQAENSLNEDAELLLQDRPEVMAVRDLIAKLDVQIQQTREIVAHQDSPRLERLREDRRLAKEGLESLITEMRPSLRAQLREQNLIAAEGSVAQIEKQIELNESERAFLRSRMSEIDESIVRTDEKSGIQLEMSRRAVDRQTRLTDSLWQSLEELKISSQAKPRVTLFEYSKLPQQASHSRQLKAAAAAAGIGWMIVILGIGCLEWKSFRIRSISDVTAQSTRPVFPSKYAGSGLAGNRNASGAQEAAARLMLTNDRDQAIGSLMVTGVSASEPRHLVSLDLSRAFAAFRRKTLLIDCDTHAPTLSRSLAADHLPGLVQACADQSDAHKYIIPSSEEGLDFLPLGSAPGSGCWIDPQALKSLLNSLRGDYQAIVVNGPAVLSSAESLLLASHVDQTIFALFDGKTRWDELVQCEQATVQAGIALFGSILHRGNRVRRTKLRFDRQGTVHPTIDREENLRMGVAAMQQDLQQATAREAGSATRPKTNRELTS